MVETSFPITYSTLSAQGLVSQALPQYDIGEVLSCQFWCRGLSDVYLVEARTGHYVLRVSHAHWRSHDEVAFELEFLDFLRSHDLPVAYPLANHDGQFLIPIQAPEGDRYAALFIYAPGKIPMGDLSAVQSHILGETVARFHQTARCFSCSYVRPVLSVEYLLEDSLNTIAPFMSDLPGDLQYLTDAVLDMQANLRDLPQEFPYWTVCWGDPHSGNVHFLKNSPTLFDFDQCGYGWRAFEVAKFFQVGLRGGVSRQVRGAFLNGYQSVQPLEDWEINSLQSFTQASHIWSWSISLINAQLHDYSRLDYHYFNQRLEQLKLLRSSSCHLY